MTKNKIHIIIFLPYCPGLLKGYTIHEAIRLHQYYSQFAKELVIYTDIFATVQRCSWPLEQECPKWGVPAKLFPLRGFINPQDAG